MYLEKFGFGNSFKRYLFRIFLLVIATMYADSLFWKTKISQKYYISTICELLGPLPMCYYFDIEKYLVINHGFGYLSSICICT